MAKPKRIKPSSRTTATRPAKRPSEASAIAIERSSGNVFADLGFPDAVERYIQMRLAVESNRIIESRELSQVAAAKLLGVNQPKISALRGYKLEGFSIERLMTFLTALGSDVEIRITSRPPGATPGRILVEAA